MGTEVFLTGASGFLGRALIDEWLANGAAVTALVRPGAPGGPLPADVRLVPGDLDRPEEFAGELGALAARSPDAVLVHGASLISYRTRDHAQQRRVNVAGTERLLELAARAGLRRAVLVGSVVSVGVAESVNEELDEDAAWNLGGVRSAYVHTKREQEIRARELSLQLGIELVTVLPGAIFGVSPRASNTARFVDEVRRRGAPPLVPPGSLGVVGVEDTARGVRLAAERGLAGRRYLLVESNATLHELFDRFARALGRRGPGRVLPRSLWRAVVGTAGGVDRFKPLDRLSPEALELVGLHFRFNARRARAELSWKPEPFQACLERLVDSR